MYLIETRSARFLALPALLFLAACSQKDSKTTSQTTTTAAPATASADAARPADGAGVATAEASPAGTNTAPATAAGPANEMGRIPILEYHRIGISPNDHPNVTQWYRPPDQFRADLEMLYQRGYRPVTMSEVIDKKINLASGLSPVVFTFDDAVPEQFRYIEQNGQLTIDPNTAIGIWLEFAKKHPDWKNKAVFCMLPAANAGSSFFGDHGIQGQKSEWRFKKVKFLYDQGFELCDHTLYHARLDQLTDAKVQEFIARGVLAIDSVIPGYKVRTFALPLGMWPKNKALAHKGSWTDPKSGKKIDYDFDAVLLVASNPAPSPYDPKFDPFALQRVIVYGNGLKNALDRLDKNGEKYVSDGNPATIAKPQPKVAA